MRRSERALALRRRRAYIARMPEKHPKRPRDPNQLAKHIIGIATGEVDDKTKEKKRPELGASAGGRIKKVSGSRKAAAETK